MRGAARGLDLLSKWEIIDVPLIALGGRKSLYGEKYDTVGGLVALIAREVEW